MAQPGPRLSNWVAGGLLVGGSLPVLKIDHKCQFLMTLAENRLFA